MAQNCCELLKCLLFLKIDFLTQHTVDWKNGPGVCNSRFTLSLESFVYDLIFQTTEGTGLDHRYAAKASG